ncbi:MAG: hypothetical protein ACPLPR_02950 [Bacillota bacterium]
MNSYKMTLPVPQDWHRRVKAEAAIRGLKLNRLIMSAVDEWLKRNPIKEGNRDGEEKKS